MASWIKWAMAVLISGILIRSVAAEPGAAALLDLHTREAESYRMFLDKEQTRPLELRTKPIFSWTNQASQKQQHGHLFVWTAEGRPEAIGTIFSIAADQPGRRALIHEFHTLSPRRLYPVTPANSRYKWAPEAGIVLSPCEEAPAPAEAASARLTQMRQLARRFSAESRNGEGQVWELRLLPTPLLQYQPEKGPIRQGALFAMVSSAGTDPEAILLIELKAMPDVGGGSPWQAAALRFSDRDLIVRYNDKPLWSSLDDPQRKVEIKNDYTLLETPDKTYTCYRARTIDELPDEKPADRN